ncbi:MAG: ATP synthase F0 subunit B [Deltaproteobacteria bacterium]|jgi:F-type H+-transporting ATPase subunit b|nr:ATP synthase F0 subunit B [Deltaproteobacteria bacterium]
MSESKSKVRVVVLAGFILCLAAFHFGYGSHDSLVDFGFRSLNFVLFLAVLWYAAGGRARAFLRGRGESIAGELEALASAKELASRHLKEVEAKIINLDKERQAILASYKAQGEALKSEIIVKAEKSARQIVAQAKVSAQNEADKAMRRLRAEMAEQILAETEKLLRERLKAPEHERLINKSLSKVVLN